jgi:hypothetical protein
VIWGAAAVLVSTKVRLLEPLKGDGGVAGCGVPLKKPPPYR